MRAGLFASAFVPYNQALSQVITGLRPNPVHAKRRGMDGAGVAERLPGAKLTRTPAP